MRSRRSTRSTSGASPIGRRRRPTCPAASRRPGRRGRRTRSTCHAARARGVWDIDGNEYVDYHNGYGVMVMGHAHPKIVEAVQRRVGARDAFRAADRRRADRRGEPRRALPAAVLAVRELRHRGDARCGADHARADGAQPHHEDRGVLPRSSRLVDGERVPARRRRPVHATIRCRFRRPSACRRASPSRWSSCRSTTPVPRSARSTSTRDEIAGMIVEPVMTNCGVVLPDPRLPREAEGHLPRERRAARVRRGEDGLHGRLGRRRRGVRRRPGPHLPREGARRRAAVRRDRRHRGRDGG